MEEETRYRPTIICEPAKNEPENVRRFRAAVNIMADTYAAKNADYGDSFGRSVRKYGIIAALTRMSDKFNRIENLILNGDIEVANESLQDSLLDLANYAVMTYNAINNGAQIK